MYKVMFCVRRKRELSLEEFQRHWLEVHAPLVKQSAGELGVRRYIQNHAIGLTQNRERPGPTWSDELYDGVAEVWIDEAARAAAGSSPTESQRDMEMFVDQSRSPRWIVQDRVIVDGTPGPNARKTMICVRRLPQLSRAEFQKYWFERHGPLVSRHAAGAGIVRYVQAHTLDDPRNAEMRERAGSPEEYEGIAMVWIDPQAATPGTPEQAAQRSREIYEDERQFVDHPRSPLWIAREQVIIG